MIIGVPREIKPNENRVGAVPSGVELLVRNGHTVLVETTAGNGSGFTDEDYTRVGATIVPTADQCRSCISLLLERMESILVEG